MVNNSILIGKYIYKFLSEDEELQNMVHGNIFPLIADEDIKFPFIIYGKESITPTYVKDYAIDDIIKLRFYIVSNNYVESMEITNKVRNILDGKTYKDNIISIKQTRIDNITEAFEEDAFIQTIYISIKCGI